MKTSLALRTGKFILTAVLAGTSKNIEIETFDFCDFNLLPPEFDYKNIEKKYGKLLGMGFDPIYDTPSGKLEPGNLFWNTWYPLNMFWDNQTEPYLMAVLPNGDHWNIDGRASNCDMKKDRLHRCWCRHGDIAHITVDKNGHTCNAGAGSIQSGDYHGFLINGEFTNC